MPFEIVDPRRSIRQTIGPDRAKLRKSGTLVLHCDTVAGAGINGSAVLLVDRATQRVALRAPQDGEADLVIQQRADKAAAKVGGVAYLVRAALQRGGWGVGKAAKYYGLKTVVTRDDGMLVVILEGGKQR